MKKKSRKLDRSEVIINLPQSVELTRRHTSNAVEFEIWISGSKRGTLILAQGSVTWKPAGKNPVIRREWWKDFIPMLEQMKIKKVA